MATTLITAPTSYPVTLEEVKTQLRVETNDDDGEIQSLIAQATSYVEKMTGRALITQTWNLVIDNFDTKIELPYPPLQSVSSITYQDLDNTTQTLSATNYTVDTDSEPGRVYQSYGGSYPAVYPDLNSVTVTFVCGYGTANSVPEVFKQAIKLHVQWIYDMDKDAKAVLDHLINQEKVNWFAQES